MKRSHRVLASLVLLMSSLGTGAVAQEPAPKSSHEKAAREFYQLIGGVDSVEAGAEAMMGVIRQNPEMAPYEDVFRAWYRKVFASGDLESEVAKLYMDAFSEDELRQLLAFYKTPIGQKALKVTPELMKQGAEIGLRRGNEHSAELLEMLDKARAERGKKPK